MLNDFSFLLMFSVLFFLFIWILIILFVLSEGMFLSVIRLLCGRLLLFFFFVFKFNFLSFVFKFFLDKMFC